MRRGGCDWRILPAAFSLSTLASRPPLQYEMAFMYGNCYPETKFDFTYSKGWPTECNLSRDDVVRDL